MTHTAQQTGSVINQQAPASHQRLVTAPTGATGSQYLLKPPLEWGWEDLRDYVVTEATNRFGEQLRDPVKEASIFKSFISRYGVQRAVLVAMAAFEIHGGTWASAPITVTRFCKRSDPFFADVILSQVEG